MNTAYDKYGDNSDSKNGKPNTQPKATRRGLSDEDLELKADMARADREDQSKKLASQLEADQTKLEHELDLKKMEARDQRDNAQIQMVIAGISGSIDKFVGIYTTVQKANLATVEARYKFILDLAKVDKDLAKSFIMNDGAEIAGEAGVSGARQAMSELSDVLGRSSH